MEFIIIYTYNRKNKREQQLSSSEAEKEILKNKGGSPNYNESIQKSQSGFGLKRINAERIMDEQYSPINGESVKLWRKPESSTINIYAKGSAGGMGLLGIFNDKNIAEHITKGGQYKATINSFNTAKIELSVVIINEFITQEDIKKKRDDDMRSNLVKKYSPKTDWILSFRMLEGYKKNIEAHIKCMDIESILKSQDSIQHAVWLEDSNGKRISDNSWPGTNEVTKTIRAINSGLELKIKDIRKDGAYYNFTVGI
jgi:hypothetical protein